MSNVDSPEHRELVAATAWSEVSGRAWAIIPEAYLEIRSLWTPTAMISLEQAVSDLDSETGKNEARGRGRPPKIRGDVEVIPLQGVLRPGMSLLELIFGIGGGLTSFVRGFKRAMDDPDIGAIVMNVDSPGGLVDLIPETAALIRSAKGRKHVVAVSNTMAASAAYWLASQADEVVVTPSGEVGSIGVYCEHRDLSGALALMGMKPTLVSAGKFKVEGNPYEPLNEEAREFMQQKVDDIYSSFAKDVATGRSTATGKTISASDIKSGYGEGRVLSAKRAVEAGLADRVETLDNVVAGLLQRSSGPSNGSSAASEVTLTTQDRERLAMLWRGEE